uniref:Uncharacterized protein n=1 Tax=Arundo donax TaxID=35708 RepID=A0A0A9BTJ0_ARUDO
MCLYPILQLKYLHFMCGFLASETLVHDMKTSPVWI